MMKFIKAFSAVAMFATLAACMQETEMAEAPMAEMSSNSVVEQFFGKSLSTENVTFIFNQDGTVGGSFRGEPVVGTYTSDATEICSTYSAPSALADQTFCSKPEVTGDSVVFNRRDGSQSPAYTISG